MSHPPLLPGRYHHYKGNDYAVLGTAAHTETGETMVIYRALYGEYALWVRPLDLFLQPARSGGEAVARFTYAGPDERRLLARDGRHAARGWIMAHGRPLEQALYRRYFENGDAADVFAALAAYQNDDGGFGHALEPDLRTPDSSVLATTHALQTLREVDAPAEHPLVQGALRFLLGAFDAEQARWPLIPPTANNAPHAPWWTVGPDHATWFRHYAVNPRAEVLAHLYHYLHAADAPPQDEAAGEIIEAAERALLSHLAALEQPLDFNELLCAIRLVETIEAPEHLRMTAQHAVRESLPATMATDAEAWEAYSLQPVAVAPAPSAAFAAEAAPYLAANLDQRVAAQETDGAWTPLWSWGDLFPDTWPVAFREWQSVLTLDALRQLAAYGRWAL